MSKLGHWRTDPEEELARIIHRDELTTIWNSNIDIVIGPGETLVWIKDGKIEDSITQDRLNNVAGGFLKWLGKKMTTGKDVKMLVVDNKPFQIEIGVQGNTSDGVEQTGMATVVLRLNSEEANLILGQLREKTVLVKKGFLRKRMEIDHYETVLTKSDLEQMIAPEAKAKVFGPLLYEYNSKTIGSKRIGDEVANRALVELRKTLGTWGLGLENIYVNWDTNAYQAWKSDRAPRHWDIDADREQRDAEIATDRRRKDEELATDRRRKGEEFDADIERRKKELEIGDLEADQEFEEQARRKKLESDQDMDELSKMMQMKEQINQQKITREKAASASELELEKVKGGTEVDKAKYNMETYERAQDKESDKMIRMMRAMKGKDKDKDKDEDEEK